MIGIVFLIFVSVIALSIALRLYNKVTAGVCLSTTKLDGKTAIVTGANCARSSAKRDLLMLKNNPQYKHFPLGTSTLQSTCYTCSEAIYVFCYSIGLETARDLAQRGARVILACRDLKKAEDAKDDIIATTKNENIEVRSLDLLSLASVRKFAADILKTEKRLDILVNNAGVGGLPNQKSEDGLDMNMQVNHFGPFLLTCLLVDLLKKSAPSRIVVVSSMVHSKGNFEVDNMNCEKSFNSYYVYCYGKLCNILMANYLADKLKGTGVTVNSLHPGVVHTEIYRRIESEFVRKILNFVVPFFFKDAKAGAQTSIHVAVSYEGGQLTGKYFSDCQEKTPGSVVRTPGLAEKVWKRSEELVKLQSYERPEAIL